MTALTIILAMVTVVAAALGLAATLAWRRTLTASRHREQAATRELAALHQRLAMLEAPAARGAGVEHTGRPAAADREFVITRLGESEPAGADRTPQVSIAGPAFADALLRESVVHTAAFVHGVRRAVAPETRNRVWFEMRRELKRTRKARKVELKEALREYRARHRAEVPADAPSRIADGAA